AKEHNDLPLMVGFNRRFSSLAGEIKKEFANVTEPFVVNIRVNAGFIPKDHWSQIPTVGGGRIVGEICHFVDLIHFFTGSDPVKVFAESITTSNEILTSHDNIA